MDCLFDLQITLGVEMGEYKKHKTRNTYFFDFIYAQGLNQPSPIYGYVRKSRVFYAFLNCITFYKYDWLIYIICLFLLQWMEWIY